MGLKTHLLIVWLIAGRFIADVYSSALSGDLLALVLIIILAIKHPKSHLIRIALLITLSVLYFDLLGIMQIHTDGSLLAAAGALITLLISYTPIYGHNN